MEPRLTGLLQAIVEEYIETAQPVGSQHLVERHKLGVSSATIRNWCAELEAAGYLMQPHTSGGRIPTEQGFRTYVTEFVEIKPAHKRERDLLERAYQLSTDDERRLKGLAKALADLSGQAVIVGSGEADTYYTGLSQLFAQPEFRNWQQVVSLTEVLDRLDEALNAVRQTTIQEPTVLLGHECPFGPSCATILVTVPSGLIGILGPIRMDYVQAVSLMSSAFHLLSSR